MRLSPENTDTVHSVILVSEDYLLEPAAGMLCVHDDDMHKIHNKHQNYQFGGRGESILTSSSLPVLDLIFFNTIITKLNKYILNLEIEDI